MEQQSIAGASYAQLRPLKRKDDQADGSASAFPVYNGLEEHLCKAEGHDSIVTHLCAVLAGWAYSDPKTVSNMMVRMGLERNRCRFVDVSNNGMLIRSSAYLVQSECGRVALLAYRGTDPFDLSTWAADGDVNPETVPANELFGTPRAQGKAKGDAVPQVHGGFYRNQRATWYDIADGLQRALAGLSILRDDKPERNAASDPGHDVPLENRLKALYITGHSLGAAMAALAAFRIAIEPSSSYEPLRKVFKGVYTFAQPMFANPAFVAACKHRKLLEGRYFAHVYEEDVVPRVPPRAAGPFEHMGEWYESAPSPDDPTLLAWKKLAHPPSQIKSPWGMLTAVIPTLAEQLPRAQRLIDWVGRRKYVVKRGLGYSYYDHMPTHYIACSQPDGTKTEFGSDF